ncbi:hypothetical protein [Pelomicrobium methylotrophicum]|uniref:Uncharacterized protein n=1 Tax=Pelomicrobium methylotrophicum TaxID=2602750 RepID=A0A5C7EUL7_9PROT|nr:hypothetical protein [Pelomicrobium methylotrophicum]TXF11942.1 hypothetical protein FR698_08035 [Pelomicrobium methylotrophicum]
MHLSDTAALHGEFTLAIYRRGLLVAEVAEPNLIVNGAKDQLARLVGGAGTGRHITHIGFGVGTAAAAPGNTDLASAFWKPVTSVSYPATGQVAFAWSLSTAEANGLAITEFGLRCADGTLFARKVRAPIHKSDDLSLTGVWTLIF